MKVYSTTTANLGDFLNSMPVLSGMAKKYGPIYLILKNEMKKFKGLKEMLMYQGIFEDVVFDNEVLFFNTPIVQLSSWYREDKNNPDRPTETCRYENFVKDHFKLEFDVDDDFEIKTPQYNFGIGDHVYLVGDRWSGFNIDARRETNTLQYLSGSGTKYNFIDYSRDMMENAFLIKSSKKPFICSLTGVSVLADLLKKETWVVWKAEDWKPEFRNGDDINWDNGKDIKQIHAKHFYLDRKTKMVHNKELTLLTMDSYA